MQADNHATVSSHSYVCIYVFIIYIVYSPIVFPIDQHDYYFPIFDSLYLIPPRAYAV